MTQSKKPKTKKAGSKQTMIKPEKKVIVVNPDGTPYDPDDYVPPHIAAEILDRHLHPEKYKRPSLNELLGPSEEEKERRREKIMMYVAKKKLEKQEIKRMQEESKRKAEQHQQEILESISINLEDDCDLID